MAINSLLLPHSVHVSINNMAATRAFPHNVIDEVNRTANQEYGVVAFDLEGESQLCRDYQL